jgi:competence protein ComEA
MSARPEPDPRRARVRMGAGAALILLLVGLAVAVFVTAITPRGSTSVVAPGEGRESSSFPSDAAGADPGPDAGVLFVHVLGQVARPGLYELSEGDRAVDAIAAAGGFTATADPGGINLARLLSDGEQLVVPAVGEVQAGAGAASGPGSGKINLNSADAATLDTLPRIGPAMAQRIIDWREANGRFSSVDDLLAVTGIGQKTLDGLRDLITT